MSRRVFLKGAAALAASAAVAGKVGADPTVQDPLNQANVRAALAALGHPALRMPDSLPVPGWPAGTDTLPNLEHIVMLMMENHSFDNFVGTLPPRRRNGVLDGFTMSRSAVTKGDAWDPVGGWNPNGVLASNPDGKGGYQNAFHMSTTCQHSGGPTQEWSASHEQYDNGKLDGFVTCVSFGAPAPAGPVSMAYFNESDLPVLYSLAEAFPIADRWFCSVLGQTDPNRRYLIAGTSCGMTDDSSFSASTNLDGVLMDLSLLVPTNGTIFDRLTTYNVPWTIYTANFPTGTTSELDPLYDTVGTTLNMKAENDFFSDCKAGNLPAFSFIDENYNTQSQENPQDVVVGEQLIHEVVTTIANSPDWASTMLILTYDEHGGYYDHVPPPVALAPDSIAPIVAPGQLAYDGFNRYGFRVPAMVISPWSRPGWVTHTVHDHTSVLAWIERKWNLPAMTFRDANANDLSDFLDMEALQAGKTRSFESICPSLAEPAPSVCPAVAPTLPPAGSVSKVPAA